MHFVNEKPQDEPTTSPYILSEEEEDRERTDESGGKKPSLSEKLVWGGFALLALLAVGISYMGMIQAPQRTDAISKQRPGVSSPLPAPPLGAGAYLTSPAVSSMIERDWNGPSGTVHFAMFLTSSIADIRYTRTSGGGDLGIRFVSLEVSSQRGYKEIFREDSAPWVTLELQQTSTRQFTLAGSSTHAATLTFDYRPGDKVFREALTFRK